MTETNGDISVKPDKIAGKIINPDAGERVKERRLRLQGPESSAIKESPQVMVDKALRELIRPDGEVMKKMENSTFLDPKTQRRAIPQKHDNATIGEGKYNGEIAQLRRDGSIVIGKIGIYGSGGWEHDISKIYRLANIESVRESIRAEEQRLHVLAQKDEHLGDWNKQRAIIRQFKEIPPELVDKEGKAFVNLKDGNVLSQHPIYHSIFDRLTPDQIGKNVTESFRFQPQPLET